VVERPQERRRVLKLCHHEPAKPLAKDLIPWLFPRMGWSHQTIDLPVPDVDRARSCHWEVHAPPDLEIRGARLLVDGRVVETDSQPHAPLEPAHLWWSVARPRAMAGASAGKAEADAATAIEPGSDPQPIDPLAPADSRHDRKPHGPAAPAEPHRQGTTPDPTEGWAHAALPQARLQVELRARREGFLPAATLIAGLCAALLIFGRLRIEDVQRQVEAAAAILLSFPACWPPTCCDRASIASPRRCCPACGPWSRSRRRARSSPARSY
jgi:hypothetical protein